MTRRPVLGRLLAQTGLGDLQGVGVTVGDEGGARGEGSAAGTPSGSADR